ncbi:MAG: LamG-like jellyroll fold domain-containing protein [Desulfobacterales bacterium]|nr:LamG-like jellyroll fold domain-containing protein [Desulfobacterales bacterium]
MRSLKPFVFIFLFLFLSVGLAHADLNNGLVAYWPFNGNANDASGNGNHGTLNGATLATDRHGNPNSAYNLDGIDDYIDIGNNVKPQFPATISLWVKLDQINDNASVFRNDQNDSGSYRYGLSIGIHKTGEIGIGYTEGYSAPSNRQNYQTFDSVIRINRWYHIVAKFNAHKNMQIFVNGTEMAGFMIDSGTGSGLSYSSANGAIGNYKTNVPSLRWIFTDGKVDDVRVYNRSLSNQEIRTLYNENDFDDDGDGYTESEGDCNDNDRYINPGAIELCDGKDNNCNGVIDEGCSNLPTSGLVAYWPFNGNANDASGNGNHGTLNGATLATDRHGNPNSAYNLDGIDDYIDIGNNVKPQFPATISLWVKLDQINDNASVFRNDQNDSGSYRYGLSIGIHKTGEIGIGYTEGYSAPSNRQNYQTFDSVIRINRWYHIVAKFNAHKNMQIFVNGTEMAGFMIDSGTGSGLSYSSANGAIGNYKTNVPSLRWIFTDGKVDDVRVYNRSLSNQEIQSLYLEDSPDNDGDGYTVSQGDCNDNDPYVNPAAIELCYDGIDNDCDGDIDCNDIDCGCFPKRTVYRFYKPLKGVHFYTASETERDHVKTLPHFKYEGPAFKVPRHKSEISKPVYRFFKKTTGVHFYTVSENEKNNVKEMERFKYEGIAYYAFPERADGTIPLYRFFKKSIGFHFYTVSEAEKNNIIENLPAYKYEGIAYYVYPK